VGCVTGMILPLRLETPAQVWFERSVGLGKGFASVRAHTGGPRVDALLPVATGRLGSGANMAFATSLLRDMGGFDPLLGAGTSCRGGDDLAAFFDVLVRGHAVVYEPGAVIWHDHHDDLKALRRAMDGYGVGLGAHLARCAIERPAASFGAVGRALLEMRRAAPTGARRLLSAAERRGVAIGAGRYLRARMGRGR
jgi:O-antigen biosynthesis protein